MYKSFLYYLTIALMLLFVPFTNAKNMTWNTMQPIKKAYSNYIDSTDYGNITEMIKQAYLLFDSIYPEIYYFEYYHEHWDYIRKKKFVFTNRENDICLISNSDSERGDTLSYLKLSKFGKQYYLNLCDSIKNIPKPMNSIQDDYINVIQLNENNELVFSNTIVPNLQLISKIFGNE